MTPSGSGSGPAGGSVRNRRCGRLLVVFMLVSGACGGEETPEDSVEIEELSEVGDCLGPDPRDGSRYLPLACDEAQATVEIISMESTPLLDTEQACPPGTDALLDARQGTVFEGDIMGLPETWCLRNLTPPHPGDPGMGGGEFMPDDCFNLAATGNISEAACASGGNPAAQYRLFAVVPLGEDCPEGTTEPIELAASLPPEVLCAALQ